MASGGAPPLTTDPDVLARAAVVIGSCWPDDGVNRNLTLLYEHELYGDYFWAHFIRAAECIAEAGGGCDAFSECTGQSNTIGGVCEPGCDGTVGTLCGDAFGRTLDCATIGMQCDPSAWCSPDGSNPSCDDVVTPSCDNGRPQYCKGGVTSGPECASFGLVCADGYCEGIGDACLNYDSSLQGEILFDGLGCDGDILHACVEGKTSDRDCSQLAPGFTCQSFDGEFFCGLGSECVPGMHGVSGTEETCSGDDLVFCHAGLIQSIDCLSLGFTACGSAPSSGAVCTPGPI